MVKASFCFTEIMIYRENKVKTGKLNFFQKKLQNRLYNIIFGKQTFFFY